MKIIKSVGMNLYKKKGVIIQFKVTRYDKEDNFFYKEWLYKQELDKEYISSELDVNSYIKISLKDFMSKESRTFALYPAHRKVFLKALNSVLDIFRNYDLMTPEEKLQDSIYENIDGIVQISKKYNNSISVNIYNDVILSFKPIIISYGGQNFAGIQIAYKNEISFEIIINDAEDICATIEEVNYPQLSLMLLNYAPPIQYGKYTVKIHPDFQDSSSVQDLSTRPGHVNKSFSGIKTY